MPKSKNAEQRYRVLDKCFSDFRKKYTFADLLESVNEKLYEVYGSSATIKTRQLRDDISNIRKLLPQDVYLDTLPSSGKECYYRYSEKDFFLYTNQLSDVEIQNLRSTIEMLGRLSKQDKITREKHLLQSKTKMDFFTVKNVFLL